MKNGNDVNKDNLKKIFKDDLDIIKNNSDLTKEHEREIYKIEKNKIDEWKNEIKKQDEVLIEVGMGIKKLNIEAKEISHKIDLNEKIVKKTERHVEKTENKLIRSNKNLKEILNKVGGTANFCVDVVLVCVCLGLTTVLYNIIKSRI